MTIGLLRLAEAVQQETELIVGLYGLGVEGDGAFEERLGLIILVLACEDTAQLDVGGRVIGMAVQQFAKNYDGLRVLADGIIGERQIIGSGNLVGLYFQ